MTLYPHSIVHPNARIGSDVIIEPFVTVEEDVVIGDGTYISAHACIKNGTRIGKNCKIFQGAIIGSDPQDQKYQDEKTYLIIEDEVTIREFCTINRGTQAAGETVIKRGALIMAYSHVAHDCLIDEHAILANNVQMAGHVYVGVHAIVGGMTAVQQFVRLGGHSFVGGGTLVRKDVPPYIKVAREPLSYVGVNTIGLKRRGFIRADILLIQDIYRILFVKNHNLSKGLQAMNTQIPDCLIKEEITEFIAKSRNGIIRGFRQLNGDDY